MKKCNSRLAVNSLLGDNFYRSLLIILLLTLPSLAQAQQARGLFFSVFGSDASADLGDFDNMQAIYFEVPQSEEEEVYLRIFDPDVSGNYEELQGKFNTETRFTLLGGESANKIYGGSKQSGKEMPEFEESDVIHTRTFGYERSLDSRYLNFGKLPPDKGHSTDDGYRRYVLIVEGLEGNDSNYFDLLLSYTPDSKDIPGNTRIYAYDLGLRVPDWPDFTGQISVATDDHQSLELSTFDMDNTPVYLERPFTDDYNLSPSGDGNWVTNEIDLTDLDDPEHINFTFEGEDFNNTFNLVVQDPSGAPLPIDLPIPNYEPPKVPQFSFDHSFDSTSCGRVDFTTQIQRAQDLQTDTILWTINSDSLYGGEVQYRFEEPGKYYYKVLVEGTVRGEPISRTFRDSLHINAPPNAWSGGDRVHIPGEPLAFDGTVSEDPDGRITSYHWNFGDGTEKTGARVDHTYEDPGQYPLTLKVFDNSNSPCNSDTHTATVKINQQPTAVIDAPQYVQVGEIFTLDASGSSDPDGSIAEYSWQIGNDTTINGEMIQYSFDQRKNWPIKLMVTDDSGVENSTAIAESVIRINKLPVAIAGADRKTSPDHTITLSAEDSYDPDGKIEEYEWILRDNTLTGMKHEVEFNTPGKHEVILRIRDNSRGGEDRDTLYVYVNHPPIPKISGDTVYNRGRVSLSAEESLDRDGTIETLSWDMGDGTEYSNSQVTHIYREPGSYNVELTVRDNSGTSSAEQSITRTVTINSLPVAEFKAETSTAPDREVTFDASESFDKNGYIESFEWHFGDGHSDAGAQVSHSYDEPGLYQVRLKVADNSGLSDAVSYAYKEIRVNAQPTISYEAPEITSAQDTFTVDASNSFDPDGEIVEYRWNINGEWQQGSNRLTINNPEELVEPIILAVIDNSDVLNSRNEETIPIDLNAPPEAAAGQDIRTHKNTVTLDGTTTQDPDGDNLSYQWEFGDGNTAHGSVVSHTYREAGRYQAILKVNDQRGLNNSIDKDSVEIFINNAPEAILDIPAITCAGDTFRYDGTDSFDSDESGNLSYRLNFGNGDQAQAASGTYAYEEPDTYEIGFRVNDNEGLANSVSRLRTSIEVVGLPRAEAGADKTVCLNEPVEFDASKSEMDGGTIDQYEWDFRDGTQANGIAPEHRFTEPGTYNVQLTVAHNSPKSCSHTDTDEVTVNVVSPPRANFDLPGNVFEGDSVVLDPGKAFSADSDIKAFTWKIGEFETIRASLLSYTDSLGIEHREWYMYSDSLMNNKVVELESLQGGLPAVHRTLPAGQYPVTLEVKTDAEHHCNTASRTKYLTVRKLPELSINDIPILAPGQTHLFGINDEATDIKSIIDGNWSFGGKSFKDGLYVNHTFKKPGTYTVAFSASPAGDINRVLNDVTRQVHVNAPPEPQIQMPDTAFVGETVEITSAGSRDPDGTIAEYRWVTPKKDTINSQNISYTFQETGNHSLSLSVVDGEGAANSKQVTSRNIHIKKRPDLSFNLPEKLCTQTSVDILSALSGVPRDSSLVKIFTNQTRIPFSDAPSWTFTSPGQHNIRVEVEANKKSQTLIDNIMVANPPEITADVPKKIYIGGANDYATFDASGSFKLNNEPVKLYWNMGDGTQKAGSTIRHNYQNPGTYTVTVTAVGNHDLQCSQASKQFTVEVEQW